MSLWEPFVSTLALKQGGRAIVTAQTLMPALSFVASTKQAASVKHAAIDDFLRRLIAARRWVDAHPREYADIWAKRANLDPDVAWRWLSTANQTIGPVDDAAARDAQNTADFLYKADVISQRFDVSGILDHSYADAFDERARKITQASAKPAQ